MQKRFPLLFHDMHQKLQFRFAVEQEAGCVSGSTLFDENTARMYSGVASKEAETRDVDRTLRAYQLTVAPQNVHGENHSCP